MFVATAVRASSPDATGLSRGGSRRLSCGSDHREAPRDKPISFYTSQRLPLRRSAMFIAGSVKTVFSSVGATSILGPQAAPTELAGLSCMIIYKHPAPTELTNLCRN
jgi:hypothetical protein